MRYAFTMKTLADNIFETVYASALLERFLRYVQIYSESSSEKADSGVMPSTEQQKDLAKVLNQDVGFVEVGMPVSIKVDTYNFQKYGILSGEVILVSPNSIEDERLGQVYEVYIKPIDTTLMVEGNEQQIKAGMTTTNEIKIGKRRIIEFFIYPLIKYLDESIKVR